MKTKLTLAICIILLNAASAQSTFQKTIGSSGIDYAYDVHRALTNGGYYFGALTSGLPGPKITCWVVRTNDNGDTLWTHSYGDTCNQYINDICPTADGGCVAVGGASICAPVSGVGSIARLDASGNLLWTKTCTASEDPYPVIQSSDGNFIVGGYVTGIGAGSDDGCIMKLDAATGDTIWSKTYGGTGDDWFYRILQTNDGGYIAAGFTTSFGQLGTTSCGPSSLPGKDIYLVKTDGNGNVIWSKAYGTSGCEYAFGHCLEHTTDGGYILTGQTDAAQGMFLMKIDSAGNIGWSRYYDGQWAHGVKQTADRGYIMAGTANGNVQLVKTDSAGNVSWSKQYGGTGAEQGLLLELANDGGYITGGYTISYGSGNKDLYIVKTDALGNSGCNESNPGVTSSAAPFIAANTATQVFTGTNTISYSPKINYRGGNVIPLCTTVGINEINTNNEITAYPNPFSTSTTIQLNKNIKNGSIIIYNIFGQAVKTLLFAGSSIQMERTDLSAGIYFIRVTESNKLIASQKIIVAD